MKRILIAFFLIAPLAFGQGTGVRKRRPLPNEFGNVVMNNFSEKNGMAPVVFSHWVHRAKYTCRLCHVDIGFAMEAGGTRIKESDNQKGYYCGACHNGRTAFSAEVRKGGAQDVKNCDRCHSAGKEVPRAIDFSAYTSELPRGRFGNNVDWEAAEIEGKVKPVDTLPEISVKRRPLDIPKDYSIEAKIQGLPGIIFSHRKHAVWHGCELCHPDIFLAKAGATKYSMQDIFSGRYCGLCHGSVAFPTTDCQRCHVKPVS